MFVWDLLEGPTAEGTSSLVLGVPAKFASLPGKQSANVRVCGARNNEKIIIIIHTRRHLHAELLALPLAPPRLQKTRRFWQRRPKTTRPNGAGRARTAPLKQVINGSSASGGWVEGEAKIGSGGGGGRSVLRREKKNGSLNFKAWM